MSSSRYQSRVLQYVAQQSMRLRDRALKGVRQARLALTWGTQMVLYPIYLTLQSTRWVGQQLQQATQRILPQLAAALDPNSTQRDRWAGTDVPALSPQSDRPLQSVLTILTEQLAIPTVAQPTIIPIPKTPGALPLLAEARPAAAIQGIATRLDERQLVLVDIHNEAHALLTPVQQAQVQQCIVLEVATYWRDRRHYLQQSVVSGQPKRGNRFLPIPHERDTMLLPVRYLRRFIGWMQTSPVAIATNVFQEAALLPAASSGADAYRHSTALDPTRDLNALSTYGVWLRPDPAPMMLPPEARVATDASGRSTVSGTQGLPPLYPDPFSNPDLALSPPTPSLTGPPVPRPSLWTRFLDWIVQAPRRASSNPPLPRPGHRSIPPLPPTGPGNFWFDPDYHGGRDGWFNANQLNQVRRQREFPPVVPSLPARMAASTANASALNAGYANMDAHLTERGLGGLITTRLSNTISEADIEDAPAFPESAAAIFNDLREGGTPDPTALEHYLAHHSAAYDFRRMEDSTLDRDALYHVSMDTITTESSSAASRLNSFDSLDPNSFSLDVRSARNPDLTTTWLDASVEIVGYEPHPLERLLGWVDSGMAWVESRIVRLWSWVCDRL